MTRGPKDRGPLAGATMHVDKHLMVARSLNNDRKDFSGAKIIKARKMAAEGATIEDIRSEVCPDMTYHQMWRRLKKYCITLRAGHVSGFGGKTGINNNGKPVNYDSYRPKMICK